MTTQPGIMLLLIVTLALQVTRDEALLCHVCGADRTNSTDYTASRCEEAAYFAAAVNDHFPIQDGNGRAPISCKNGLKGEVVECNSQQPFCLSVASNVCVGQRFETEKQRTDNACDSNFFYCWQKGCGDLSQIRTDFLPDRLPGCKYMDHPTSAGKNKPYVDTKRTIICVCDTDYCNSDSVDLTGETLPAPYRDVPYKPVPGTALRMVKDAAMTKHYLILDQWTKQYRKPTQWESIYLIPPGEQRDEAIAQVFNKKFQRDHAVKAEPEPINIPKHKLEPGVSHDLLDTSLKLTIPLEYYGLSGAVSVGANFVLCTLLALYVSCIFF